MTLQQTTAFAKKLIDEAPNMFNPNISPVLIEGTLIQFLLMYSYECDKEKLAELNEDNLFETIDKLGI